jgi:hypothetical protein
MMLPEQVVREIHAAPGQIVVALNGGSRAIAELLEVPGGSKTLLEATAPYSDGALTAWLGSRPEHACSSRTARSMAVVAFGRAMRYGAKEQLAAGISGTAALASDRPKRGPHRAHVAAQTADKSRHWCLELEKGKRTRREEEEIVSRIVLNAIAEACAVEGRLELALSEREQVTSEQITAPLPWQELFLGRIEATEASPRGSSSDITRRAVLSGAFDPLHAGHRRMADLARHTLGLPTVVELSIENVDKPVLDYVEIARRLAQFPPQQAVWLTRAATFDAKSRLFPGATFVVGVDTVRRIADPRYYRDDPQAMMQALARIIDRDCRFLVFGRAEGSSFIRLSDLNLPDVLRRACREVPPEEFREDVSSTALRKEGTRQDWPT